METPELCPVTALLSRGGVVYGIPAENKIGALVSAVEKMLLPDGVDRDRVIEEILRREDIASTGIGQGIALPHPQNAASLQLPESVLTLAFLAKPVDFEAPDGVPVQTLFVILSHDAGQHLRLLAHLGRTLQNTELQEALASQRPSDEILALFHRVESALHERRAALAAAR
jgi:PTS system nitrogen regulatory IIA component